MIGGPLIIIIRLADAIDASVEGVAHDRSRRTTIMASSSEKKDR